MASILTGTPINTGGIHPLAALMGQGSDVLARSFGMASNRMTANNSIAVSFMRDAMQERMEAERQKLTREKMEMDAALQREAMDQRERLASAELASREKMAADRLALAGRRASGVSAQQGGQGGIDMGGLMNALMDRSFQQAGAQPPTPAQAPLEGPTLPPGFAQDGGQQAGPNLPIEAYNKTAVADDMAVREARSADLSNPDNADRLGMLYQKQAQYNAIAAQMAPTASSQLMYGGKAIQSMIDGEKYAMEKAKGAKGDLGGLAAVDNAISEQLDPLEGLIGKKFATAQDVEAAVQQDPTLKGVMSMLTVDSTQLRRDLENATIDEIGTFSDYFNKGASALENQQNRASYLATAASPASSRTDARKIVQETFNDTRTVQGRMISHRDTIDDLLVSRIKEADLSKMSPRTLANAGFKLQNSIAGTDARIEQATSRQDYLRDKIRDTIKASGIDATEEEINKWGTYQIEQAKQKFAEGEEEPMDSPEYRQLNSLQSAWNSTNKELSKEKAKRSELGAQLGRVANYNRRPNGVSPGMSEDEGDLKPEVFDIQEIGREISPGDLNQKQADDLFKAFGQ